MTEQELRALVREAIARHVSGAAVAAPIRRDRVAARLRLLVPTHASHGLFVAARRRRQRRPVHHRAAVMCNHCGYCKSYGH